MDEVLIVEKGETIDVLARWKRRLGQKNPEFLATRAEIIAVLRFFDKLPPKPQDKIWK